MHNILVLENTILGGFILRRLDEKSTFKSLLIEIEKSHKVDFIFRKTIVEIYFLEFLLNLFF